MSQFGVVEDTLFVPMLGRIYASECCPQVLYDKEALSLKNKLPAQLLRQEGQSQYTLLASAVRSANMDRYIRDFQRRKPNGAVVQLGCGLETACFRNEDQNTRWYAVDLPNVIAYRQELLPQQERETCIAADAFADTWIKRVRAGAPDAPLLVTAGGLFHYFQEEKVVGLLRMLRSFGNIELVFDTVNGRGMRMMRKKYMKQVGHEDAQMFFYVDSAEALAAKAGEGVRVLAEEPYYRHTPKAGLKLSTRLSMVVSDRFAMVKMVCVFLSDT